MIPFTLCMYAASHLRWCAPPPDDATLAEWQEEAVSRGTFLFMEYCLLDANDPPYGWLLSGMLPGMYEHTEATEQYIVDPGPYDDFTDWVAELCHFAFDEEADAAWQDPARVAGRPFSAMISVMRCFGRVGSKLAAKLAAEFREHADRAAEYATTLNDGAAFIDVYQRVARAFDVASQDGGFKFL